MNIMSQLAIYREHGNSLISRVNNKRELTLAHIHKWYYQLTNVVFNHIPEILINTVVVLVLLSKAFYFLVVGGVDSSDDYRIP